MIVAKLVIATSIIGAAMGPPGDAPTGRLSLQQRNAATQAYVRPVTDCIANSVVSNPRFRKHDPTANLTDLIVEAVPNCIGPVRAMIAAHDRYFGEGAGEDFFMGPYLDLLPDLVLKRTNAVAE